MKKLLCLLILGCFFAHPASALVTAPNTNCNIATADSYGCIKIGAGLAKSSTGALYVTATNSGSGSSSLSALTSSTTINTVPNFNFAQTWTWNTLTTQSALSLTSTSLTSGNLLVLGNSNAAATGKVLSLSNTATGTSYGIYSALTATGNTGYSGYFSNSATTGTALYVSGNCVGCAQLSALYYTATSRTIASTDVNNLITYNSTSSGSWQVPVAGSAGFAAPNATVFVSNMNTGALTLTATGGSLFNGLGGTTTSLVLQRNQWVSLVPDASNNWNGIGNLTVAGTLAVQPASYYTTDTGGNLFPYVYTGSGGNVSTHDAGWGVAASLAASPVLEMRFPMPSQIPSGTFKLRSVCMTAAGSGTAKYTVSDANVTSGSSPSAATLTGETQTSLSMTTTDGYLQTDTTLTSTPIANDTSVVAVTFNTSGWTLAQILLCRWTEVWN